jgi:hypothetical protein
MTTLNQHDKQALTELLREQDIYFDGTHWREWIGDGRVPLDAHEQRINDEGGRVLPGSGLDQLYMLSFDWLTLEEIKEEFEENEAHWITRARAFLKRLDYQPSEELRNVTVPSFVREREEANKPLPEQATRRQISEWIIGRRLKLALRSCDTSQSATVAGHLKDEPRLRQALANLSLNVISRDEFTAQCTGPAKADGALPDIVECPGVRLTFDPSQARIKPDARDEHSHASWLRLCIGATGLSQAKVAKLVGITDRMMRAYLADPALAKSAQTAPYTIQYALEQLAQTT